MPWVTSQQPESVWTRPPVVGLLVTSPGPLHSLKGPVRRTPPGDFGPAGLRTAPPGPLQRHLQRGNHVPVPSVGAGGPPLTSRKVWEAREASTRQIGLRITHSKQSKLYLLPREPELLTAKRDLW